MSKLEPPSAANARLPEALLPDGLSPDDLLPDDLTILVVNEGAGWRLECSPHFEALMFRSGRAAEAAARSIAARFALSGQGVHMAIEDRRHATLGTTTFFALPVPAPTPFDSLGMESLR